jgi:CheY-like chemotaxis protein
LKDSKASILIVEDEKSVRTSLAEVFTSLGYRTRCAADGLNALIEIRREVPDILLSDLNMPEMSGFELLSVIHRRFPAMFVIAMSGMFTETHFPTGVTADAYYQKGGRAADLVKIVESRYLETGRPQRDMPEPIWIQRNGHNASGGEFVTIACPECFRTFPQPIDGTASAILDTSCVFCDSWFLYAIVDPRSLEFPRSFQPVSPGTRPDASTVQLRDRTWDKETHTC